MSRPEIGFKGARLVGVTPEDNAVLGVTVPADATNGIDEVQEIITALAARIRALEDAAA